MPVVGKVNGKGIKKILRERILCPTVGKVNHVVAFRERNRPNDPVLCISRD